MQQLQDALPLGSILRERYVIEGLLGKGGYGSVYLVRDMRVKQNLYALKENHSPDKKDRQRFLFEGDLLTRLDHRSLPRVYRVFEDESQQRTFMLMDYIEGSNLERLRQRQLGNRLRLAQVLSIMAPIVDALHYLHRQPLPVLHRDIKPSNIIVPDSGDDAVLVDFGIAKEYDPDSTTTAFRSGSPGYAAPEQYSRGTSTRSDIYGLGATFYTLLTGALPADALFRMTTTGSDQSDPLEPVNKMNPSIPLPAAQAIQKAMSLNANERFSNVEAFWLAFASQPGWEPLHWPRAASRSQAALPDFQLSNGEQAARVVDTPLPLPPVVRPSNRRRSHRFKRLVFLLLLLALLVGSGASLGIFYYLTMHPGSSSRAVSPGTISTPVRKTSTPVSVPTVKPTSTPRPAHTAQPGITPTAHTGATPMPQPTFQPTPTAPPATPAPTPAPRPSPTPAPIPVIAGNYNGTIDDTTANIITGMALSIKQKQGNISGRFTVNPPLIGNGNFTGTVNTTDYVQLFVQSYKGNAPLYFWGWVQADGSLKGDYCSVNKQNQCDPNAGASGTWDVAKAGVLSGH